ncbi:hypothetical protein P879_06535 [Paragonimus westermani]|uniref:Uncharacterized protein n=1 Tax=Paragonimus westermani TaxID=34504 RepID=A0A8T0DLF4_9TREM|nr:hypothetical protein P879_06535 [Paragonimus westermani]
MKFASLHFIFFLWSSVDYTTDAYVYNYFPMDHQLKELSVEDISHHYIVPKFPLLPYKTIEEITAPTDLLTGRLYASRQALANVIHYVQGGTFLRMLNSRPAVKTNKFRDVLFWWRYFYLCLTTYSFRKHYGPCTDGFVNQTNDNKYYSILDWVPERDLDLLPLGHEMLLIIFNLGLCQHYHNHLPFLCPSACLGRIKAGLKAFDGIPSEYGNPCEQVRNVRTFSCKSRRVWSVYIYQLFSELVDPANWNRLTGEHYLNWLTEEGGYVCDCADRHRWVDTSMRCERISEWSDKCDNNSTRLGPCDKHGTYQCTTDQ